VSPAAQAVADPAAEHAFDSDPGERFLAIVNPAAGGGRCGRLAPGVLASIRKAGVEVDVAESFAPGEATRIARDAYARGRRRFLAVGGDGTSFEIVNGIFPAALTRGRVTLGFLPLGTGNSFLRDFVPRGTRDIEFALEAIGAGRTRRADVVRCAHAAGTLYYLNLLSVGFSADVAALVNRRLKRLGQLGYLLGVLVTLARMRRRSFPLRADGGAADRRPCLFLSFSNSQYTGGTMRIAPDADPADGRIEYVRWGPIGRAGLIWNLPGLYSGAHIRHRLAERSAVERIEFELAGPVDAMVDGESLELALRRLDVLPGALDVLV
jgi:YegS/Rv2252/BmrU family lipid kinase